MDDCVFFEADKTTKNQRFFPDSEGVFPMCFQPFLHRFSCNRSRRIHMKN